MPDKLPNDSYSVSDTEDYIEFFTEKHEKLPTKPPINIYINRINGILLFEIKDGYKLDLQTPETMKLFGSTQKINRENIKWRKCNYS